ncbi:PilZ domain-containing protein [Vibrio ostreicida]|uniref:PilZ domain-containing protein n=1 Tax=Vibrio ostreicida TaxID=526588 RepID=A0ABT8BVE0_9VIBR|nr:PilZ domain-containing protein [Vibrio ostreicida]MDN3610349.1 PilZ domain-containing protein [Vibrio ostreicida]NPD07639.1 PilZ domain-containing protein [Vibrio ostreicida]
MAELEYFTVHHQMTINVEPLAQDACLPSFEQFEGEIPAPFIVASEFSHLDILNDNARSELKNSDFKHVIELLDTQNAKLNLLLTFMLSQQDDIQYRRQTLSFGASKFSYNAETALPVGTKTRVKLFLEHPPAAIYGYGHVETCEQESDSHHITIKFDLLRDQDEDLLIKAALFQQQKLLRQRSLNRDKKN